MLDINVKTIDGQNRSYSVPDSYSVRQFKEKIASSMDIPVDRQRLIFQGRELKDPNLLSEFDVNGKTLHLVQRVPPIQGQQTQEQQQQQRQQQQQPRSNIGQNAPPEIQNIIQQIMGSFGGAENVTINTNDSTNGMEVHINLENTANSPSNASTSSEQNQAEIRSRIRNIRRFLSMAESRLHRLHEIQSGAQLDDSQNTAIVIGRIQGTATLSDGSVNEFWFDSDPRTIRASDLFHQAVNAEAPPQSESNASARTTNSTESNNDQASSTATTVAEPESSSAESNSIGVEVLADVVSSVMDAYSRFQPYLQQYHDMLTNDANEAPDSPRPEPETSSSSSESTTTSTTSAPTNQFGDNRRQRFCNNINDMMHLLGHLFHNLSDLHVNIRDSPPRQMHTMNSMQFTTSIIPVEASIQIPFMLPMPASTQTSTSSSSSSSSGSTTTTTTAPSSSGSVPASAPTPTPTPTITPTPTPAPAPIPTPNLTQAQRPQTTAERSTRPQPQGMGDIFSRIAAAAAANATGAARSQPSSRSISQSHNFMRPINSYDEFLPCNSVHFYNAPIPQSNLLSNAQRMPDTQSPRIFQRPNSTRPTSMANNEPANNDMNRLFSNIFAPRPPNTTTTAPGTFPAQRVRINVSGGNLPGVGQSLPFGSFLANTRNNPTGQLPNAFPNAFLEQLLGGPPRSNATPSSTVQPGTNQSQVANNILREAISLIGSNNPNDQRLNQPLQEFLRNLGFSDDEDESENDADNSSSSRTAASSNNTSLNIFNILFSSMTLGDVINLARGQNTNQVFERSRLPLRNYIRQHFSVETGQDFSPDLVDRLYKETFIDENGLELDLNQLELTAEAIENKYDFPKSFENLVKHHLRILIEHIFDESFDTVPPSTTTSTSTSPPTVTTSSTSTTTTTSSTTTTTTTTTAASSTTTWSSELIRKFYDLIYQLVTLCRACLKDADQKFTQIVIEKLSNAMSENDLFGLGLFENIINSLINSHVQQILSSIRLEKSQIERFIAYKTEIQSTAATKVPTSSTSSVDGDEDERYDSVSSTLSSKSVDIDACVDRYRETCAPTTSTTSNAKTPNITSNQPFESSTILPAEWCPIIQRDMETQFKESESKSVRAPYSDAYLSGMPAKRRKIILPKNNELLSTNLFSRVLRNTLDQVELKPGANVNDLFDASLNNAQLIDSFQSEFNEAITDRLKSDKDFIEICASSTKMSDTGEENTSNEKKKRFQFSRKRLD